MKTNQVFLVIALVSLFFSACSAEPILETESTESIKNTSAISKETVEISLSWYGKEDLDLHVIEPNGKHLFFGETISTSGGILRNTDPNCHDTHQLYTESFSYSNNSSRKGTYQVYVDVYGTCGSSIPEWTLTIKVNDVERHHINKIDMVTVGGTLDPTVEPISFNLK